jgi:Protein of unknown function (DUF998)
VQKSSPLNRSQFAARISVAATGLFLALLAGLHALKPEVDPSWRMISEYEIGRFGWLMQMAFFLWALGNASLFVAIRSHVRSTFGNVGLTLLLVVAVGMIIGGIFIPDPITTGKDALSTASKWHSVGGALAIIPMPIIATLVSWSLVHHNQAWLSVRCLVLWLTAFIWLGLGAFLLVAVLQHDGTAGPDVLLGWPNRTFAVAYSVWLMAVAWKAIRVQKDCDNKTK